MRKRTCNLGKVSNETTATVKTGIFDIFPLDVTLMSVLLQGCNDLAIPLKYSIEGRDYYMCMLSGVLQRR